MSRAVRFRVSIKRASTEVTSPPIFCLFSLKNRTVMTVCRTLSESFIELHDMYSRTKRLYAAARGTSLKLFLLVLVLNQRYVNEHDSFPFVNEAAVKSRMPRELYSAVSYTVLEDLGVSWRDFVIR